MPKQTAVQWILQRFEDGDMYNVEDAQFIKHQALAMEKEQIVNAVDGFPLDKRNLDGEQYYNETFKGGQDES
jgi:hypothetical protein